MKRRTLLKKLRMIAKARGAEFLQTEGKGHTKIAIGEQVTFVPRHAEVNEHTAKAILKQIGE